MPNVRHQGLVQTRKSPNPGSWTLHGASPVWRGIDTKDNSDRYFSTNAWCFYPSSPSGGACEQGRHTLQPGPGQHRHKTRPARGGSNAAEKTSICFSSSTICDKIWGFVRCGATSKLNDCTVYKPTTQNKNTKTSAISCHRLDAKTF